VLVITAGSKSTEATAQSESDIPAKKSAPKGNGKRNAEVTDGADE
jgi:hypothetical protein